VDRRHRRTVAEPPSTQNNIEKPKLRTPRPSNTSLSRSACGQNASKSAIAVQHCLNYDHVYYPVDAGGGRDFRLEYLAAGTPGEYP